jgi:3-deoxy-manno-octulosonate cytidylyltransferase (CMP-KDO synthetase)
VKAAAILPARLHSTRLPRKMLLAETGRTLIEHSARNAIHTGLFARVVVATDSEEIREALERAGVEAVLTREDHPSGTDRVLEAARKLDLSACDVLVNVQGDEPEIARADLASLVDAFREPEVELATLCTRITRQADVASAQVVKVVRDARGDALYFSRAPIPSTAHARPEADADAREAPAAPRHVGAHAALRHVGAYAALRHVGVYAFRPEALERFCALPVGRLERLENLEQLRWLEAGRKLRVLDAAHAALGIDTRAEYDAFVARCKAREAS